MKKEEFISKIDLTIIITILIGIGYFLTYVYESARLMYYDIPLQFLSVDIEEVIFMIFIISPLLISNIIGFTIYKNIEKYGDNNSKLSKVLSKIFTFRELKDAENNLNQLAKEIFSKDTIIDDLEQDILSWKSEILNRDFDEIKDEEEKHYYEENIKNTKYNENKLKDLKQQQQELKERYKRLREYYNKTKRNVITYNIYIAVSTIFIISLFIFTVKSTIKLTLISILVYVLFISLINFLFKKDKMIESIVFVITVTLIYTFCISLFLTDIKEKYITFEKDDEPYIVLTTYKNQFLSAPINRKTNKVDKSFEAININDVNSFSKEDIGEIKM